MSRMSREENRFEVEDADTQHDFEVEIVDPNTPVQCLIINVKQKCYFGRNNEYTYEDHKFWMNEHEALALAEFITSRLSKEGEDIK